LCHEVGQPVPKGVVQCSTVCTHKKLWKTLNIVIKYCGVRVKMLYTGYGIVNPQDGVGGLHCGLPDWPIAREIPALTAVFDSTDACQVTTMLVS
jgi:transketolase C-terminal domain/subunit